MIPFDEWPDEFFPTNCWGVVYIMSQYVRNKLIQVENHWFDITARIQTRTIRTNMPGIRCPLIPIQVYNIVTLVILLLYQSAQGLATRIFISETLWEKISLVNVTQTPCYRCMRAATTGSSGWTTSLWRECWQRRRTWATATSATSSLSMKTGMKRLVCLSVYISDLITFYKDWYKEVNRET